MGAPSFDLCSVLTKGGFPPISTVASGVRFLRHDEACALPAMPRAPGLVRRGGGRGKPQPFACPLHKITPHRRTMGIEKPMKEIAAAVEVASAFPGLICQGSAQGNRMKGMSHEDHLESVGHDFTGCGKTHPGLLEASGHDFSRAASAMKSMRASAPAVRFSGFSAQRKPFSAASSVVPETKP